MGNLDDLIMSEEGLSKKGDYPGPTLYELINAGFRRYNISIMCKRDGNGNIVDVYRKEPGKEYYSQMTLKEFEIFKTEVARKLKSQLKEIKEKKEVSA